MQFRRCLFGTLILTALVALGRVNGQPVEGGVRVYQNVLKSTVWVISDRGAGQTATGSGTLIDRRRRLVLTNYHVVGDIDRVTVIFPVFRDGQLISERSYYKQHERELGIRGTVKARDKQADMAIIQIERVPEGALALSLSPQGVLPGQTVHSLGNPGSSGALWVYTPGKVRQVYQRRWVARAGREEFQFEARIIETDSPTNPGDSGGPLANDRAELVGVTQGGATQAASLSTFIDISEVNRFLNTQSVRNIPRPPGQSARDALPVKDNGNFFSADAVAKANQEVRLIHHNFGRDVLVETYPRVPSGQEEKAKGKTPAERDAFFRDWTLQRARAEDVNGVVILVCREPSYFFVDVTESARSVIDNDTARKVRETLQTKFRERQFDDGLLTAIRQVRDRLERHGP
jgi:S1-C subfamily serine protease